MSPATRAAALIALFVALHLPQLGLVAFFNEEEAVNVATALELKRDGTWKLPTLAGQPRREKPPLAAWATSAFVVDPDRWLEFQARLPALLCAALTLWAVWLVAGRLAREHGQDDHERFSILALVLCATNLLFLRHAQLNMADTWLSAACAAAHAGLALAYLGRRSWGGMNLAGVALGLGIMAKGHMILLHVLVPWIVFLAATGRWRAVPVRPAAAGGLLMLVIGGWWYVWVGATEPGMVEFWIAEATRGKSSDIHADRWYAYLAAQRLWLPWAPLLIIGAIAALRELAGRRFTPHVLALLMFLLPLLVMQCFSERKDRYLLPLVFPVSLVAARGAMELLRNLPRPRLQAIAAATMLAILIGHGVYWWTQGRGEKGESMLAPLAAVIDANPDAQLFTWHPRGDFVAVRSDAAALSLEINRTLTWTDTLPAGDARAIVFTVQSKRADPPALPDGWRLIGEVERHNRYERLYAKR